MQKFGVDIKWLAVTSFEMKFNNTTVVSDPYITECVGTDLDYTAVENCDIICLSHAHWDHVTDIPRLMEKFSPKVLCGDMTAMPLAKWLNCPASKIYPTYPNLELDFGDVKIKSLFGRHKLQRLGYNDMTAVAPDASLVGTRIDWSIYFTEIIKAVAEGKELLAAYDQLFFLCMGRADFRSRNASLHRSELYDGEAHC